METMTLGKLLNDIVKLAKKDKSVLNKKILLSDDDEGNGYHEMFFSITSDENDVRENIEYSNGAGIELDECKDYVIIG